MNEKTYQPSPQRENGFVAIANEIWDVLSMIRLTANQYRAIRLVLRLSYGCQQKACKFEKWDDFHFCGGVHYTAVGVTLRKLEKMRILVIEWDKHIVMFNKHYSTWNVESYPGYDSKRYAELVVENIKNRGLINPFSKILSDLAKCYLAHKQSANSQLAKCYLVISKMLSSALVKPQKQRVEEPLKDIKDNKYNAEKIINPNRSFNEKEKWLCREIAKRYPGWSANTDEEKSRIMRIGEFIEEDIKHLIRFTKKEPKDVWEITNWLLATLTKNYSKTPSAKF